MTVEPGFGGQSFMEDMMPKVKEIRRASQTLNPNLLIEVDGGISNDTVAKAAAAGADVAVAGTAVFKAENSKAAIEKLKALAQTNG